MKTDDAERIVKWFADTLEQGKDFTLEQAPDVVQELILWKEVESLIVLGIITLVALGMCILCRFCHRRSTVVPTGAKCGDPEMNWRDGTIFFGILALVFWLFAVPVTVISYLQVWIAPKLYALEYAMHLLNKR